jgi:hypothetical protein
LQTVHRLSRIRRRIVVAEEMQETVQNVEPHLVFRRNAIAARLPRGCVRADDDFPVLKREHVRGTGDAAELLVQLRDSTITHD